MVPPPGAERLDSTSLPATLLAAVQAARAAGHLSDASPAVVLHDLGALGARLRSLRESFPAGTLHAVAIKANPLVGVLRFLVGEGAGLEAASLEELELGLAAGCAPGRLLFDSPAKTERELARALELGVRINADSAEELRRLGRLLRSGSVGGSREAEAPRIGLRINPLVGEGAIQITSVAHRGSKFGVPLPEDPAPLVELVRAHPFVTGLHVHAGSQGCPLEMLVEAVARVHALLGEINARSGGPRLRTLDIGGGLPAAYRPGEVVPSFPEYVARLRARVPGLLEDVEAGRLELLTEFGRHLHAPCGFAVSRVEYVKEAGDGPIAVVHLGADLLPRVALRPDEWYHELSVLDPEGRPKAGPRRPFTVAGPLCFSGDLIARGRVLPEIAPGDLVVIHDVGAYTLGMWSRHCSRAMPAVLGVLPPLRPGEAPRLELLRRRETPADVVSFWSP